MPNTRPAYYSLTPSEARDMINELHPIRHIIGEHMMRIVLELHNLCKVASNLGGRPRTENIPWTLHDRAFALISMIKVAGEMVLDIGSFNSRQVNLINKNIVESLSGCKRDFGDRMPQELRVLFDRLDEKLVEERSGLGVDH